MAFGVLKKNDGFYVHFPPYVLYFPVLHLTFLLSSLMAFGVLKKNDRRRAAFYKNNTEYIWDNWSGYDLCLNSGTLGIDGCVELIISMLQWHIFPQ